LNLHLRDAQERPEVADMHAAAPPLARSGQARGIGDLEYAGMQDNAVPQSLQGLGRVSCTMSEYAVRRIGMNTGDALISDSGVSRP
jgi:hypothetical protein